MTKDDIRKRSLEKRDSLTPEDLSEKSRAIFEKVTALQEYIHADSVLIYASMRSEVITDDIILDSLAAGKKVFCPKVMDRAAGRMEFVRIHAMEDLKPGYFGIPEPEITEDSEIAFSAKEPTAEDPEPAPRSALVIVPGVAFDKNCNRIGYSGGFYDRYLSRSRDLTAIALSFDCQMVEEGLIVPQEHDVRPQLIITETSTYRWV